MGKCKKCGKKLEQGEKFCSRCGVKINRNKKKIVLVLLVTCILSVAILSFIVWKKRKAAIEAVDIFLNAYVRSDGQVCGEMLYNNLSETEIKFSDTQSLLAEGITYEIAGGYPKKDYVIVELQIKNTDFAKVFEKLILSENAPSPEEVNTAISEANGAQKGRKIFSCKVIVYEVDGKMKIAMTDTFSNALFGGMNEYITTLLERRE